MNVKDLNIWKTDEGQDQKNETFLCTGITELNLSVRSFNCLKRANCNTVRDVLERIGEDGQGLRRIRNLGSRSEAEIIDRINEYRKLCAAQRPAEEKRKVTIIRPAKKVWNKKIDEFHLSDFAAMRLKKCGINRIGDLYQTDAKKEPGWYAVRELFEEISNSR